MDNFDFIKTGEKVYFGGTTGFPKGEYIVEDIINQKDAEPVNKDTVILITKDGKYLHVFADEVTNV